MGDMTPIGDAVTEFVIGANKRAYSDDIVDAAKRCLVDSQYPHAPENTP